MSEASPRGAHAAFPWYASGAGAWFTSWGVVQVVVTWLLAGVMGAGGAAMGNAQSALQLPSLFFLLVGGVVADRFDARRVLALVNGLALVPIAALALGLAQGRVGQGALIAFCLALGTCSAFGAPARDGMLSALAGVDLMRAVTALTIFQFGGQFLGTLAGGSLSERSVLAALALPAALLAFGAYAPSRLPPPVRAAHHGSAFAALLAGLATVARTPALRIPVGLVTAIGVFFMGSFAVAFPLVVRDVYHGGAFEFGLVQAIFPAGTIVGSLAIRARGGIARKGRAMLLAMTNGAAMLALLSLAPSFELFMLGALAWGIGGAVFINSSRALVQETAPADQRGRILSVYQLGFVGSFPLGAQLAGRISELHGPLAAMRVSALGMALVLAAVTLFSRARRL
ncbi:MAG TPA: MFS transporter [Myxococcota bacterium]